MTVTISAFESSPDRGRGLARDMPVRWALEEVGQAYDVRLVSFQAMKTPEYRSLQPFGQIPTFEDSGLVLFESGAIVLHIAERHPGLLPEDPNGRARAVSWMFAALNTIEPVIVELSVAKFAEGDRSWYQARLPLIEGRIGNRLKELSDRLGSGEWLEGRFTAGDLLMVSVLRRLGGSALIEAHPNLRDYVARGEARPAFQRAFAAQLAIFTASAAKT